jgi:hypothetical protein
VAFQHPAANEELFVVGREGGEIQDRIAMRADWSRKVRIGGALVILRRFRIVSRKNKNLPKCFR